MTAIAEYLRAEQRRGRITAGANCAAAAALLAGGCFQYAFLRCFEQRQPDAAEIDAYAASVTGTLKAGLTADRRGTRRQVIQPVTPLRPPVTFLC